MKNNPRQTNQQGGSQGYTSQDQNPQFQGSQNRIPENQNPRYQGSKDQSAQSTGSPSWDSLKARDDAMTAQQRPRGAEGEDKYAAGGHSPKGFEPTGQRGDPKNRAEGTDVMDGSEGDDLGRIDQQARKGRSVQPGNTPTAHSHR